MSDLTTRHEPRCPNCGQPLVLGQCTLCGPRPAPRPAPPEPSAPPLLTDAPAVPRPVLAPLVHEPRDRNETLLAVAVALLILSLLASLFLIVRVSSLDSKLKDEREARQNAENRVSIVEGSIKNVQDDQQSVHSQLDAQAAADPTAIASRVQPSVYTVETSRGSLGSAWIASSDHITAKFVTNYHVIADSWDRGETGVQIFQDENAPLDGTIEQALPDFDLALVSVHADLPALKQSRETPRPGEAVLVIGSPLGLGGSVTTGAVSALRPIQGLNFIQFSAPISPGNSGGPLVNSLGEVIGITEAKAVAFGAEGIAIAIPVNQVCAQLHVC